ncbi:MAG: hypothetical protein J5611_00230 [Alphaproteobacteria bacterium]|jgi:hypothetical protein|nr:hypothetical protein [Alphaproteobacteria bacterium]
MKKSLLSVVAGVAVIGSASAAMINKDNCALFGDRMVWVDADKVCVPRDVCTSNSEYKRFYCNEKFANIGLENADVFAKRLVNMDLIGKDKKKGKKCEVQKVRFDDDKLFVQCEVGKQYYEYQFLKGAQVSNLDSVLHAVCEGIYSGGYSKLENLSYCEEISEEDCKQITDDIIEIGWDRALEVRFEPVNKYDTEQKAKSVCIIKEVL